MTESRTAPHAHSHHLRVQRTARYYTLGGESGMPKTIWFVLHGHGQLAAQFIRYFADLADPDTLIVAPEAMNRYYLVGVDKAAAKDRPVGATWMTREDRDSEIADYVEYLETLYDEVIANGSESAATINVVGFSQGAATASRWLMHGHARIDRLILWGGVLPPDADLQHGKAFRGVPLTFVAGNRDQYIDTDLLAQEKARLDAVGIPYDFIPFDGGHVISRSVFPSLRARV